MGKKLIIYLIDGTEYGARTIEIGNWSGKAIYAPRAKIENILSRDDLQKPAVYFLKADSDHDDFSEKIYIR